MKILITNNSANWWYQYAIGQVLETHYFDTSTNSYIINSSEIDRVYDCYKKMSGYHAQGFQRNRNYGVCRGDCIELSNQTPIPIMGSYIRFKCVNCGEQENFKIKDFINGCAEADSLGCMCGICKFTLSRMSNILSKKVLTCA